MVNPRERPYGEMMHGEVRGGRARCLPVGPFLCWLFTHSMQNPHTRAKTHNTHTYTHLCQVIHRVIHQGMRPAFKPGAWPPFVKVDAHN